MGKLLPFVLLALGLLGCSHACHDGSSGAGVAIGPVGLGSSSYHSCPMDCLRAEDPRPCRCSNACPCWRQHPPP